MTPAPDDQPLELLIASRYPKLDPRRIAALRILHACENVESALRWCADTLAAFLAAPLTYRDMLPAEAEDMAKKLEVLAAELRKSVPVFTKREAHVEQDPRLRGSGPKEPGQGERPAPTDWDDVPF